MLSVSNAFVLQSHVTWSVFHQPARLHLPVCRYLAARLAAANYWAKALVQNFSFSEISFYFSLAQWAVEV